MRVFVAPGYSKRWQIAKKSDGSIRFVGFPPDHLDFEEMKAYVRCFEQARDYDPEEPGPQTFRVTLYVRDELTREVVANNVEQAEEIARQIWSDEGSNGFTLVETQTDFEIYAEGVDE